MCPLKIQLNLLHQRKAVGTSDVKLFRFSDPILLKEQSLYKDTRSFYFGVQLCLKIPVPGGWWCQRGLSTAGRAPVCPPAPKSCCVGCRTLCSRRCLGSCWCHSGRFSCGSLAPVWTTAVAWAPGSRCGTAAGLLRLHYNELEKQIFCHLHNKKYIFMVSWSHHKSSWMSYSQSLALTCRFGVFQPFADLRCKTLDQGVNLVTSANRIIDHPHGVYQRWAAGWSQLKDTVYI